jgi:hypothetical protein
MKRIVMAMLWSLCSSVPALASSVVSLSQLQPGERLHIAYYSRGCFHERKYEIDFERGKSVVARNSGRSITLSAREVAGLDKLIDFYRTRHSGGCTTEDKITISLFRDGQKTSGEHYVDGSCATGEMKGITRIYDIAKKLGLVRES